MSEERGLNDFVKKLYTMLRKETYRDVVRWTPGGSSFVVLNTNEFTKEILPTHFKHSNFASFVRQLNKYDFHKVKMKPKEKQYGDDAWEFHHPEFRKDDPQALENIRRKAPTKKDPPPDKVSAQVSALARDVVKLQKDLQVSHTNYKHVVDNMLAYKAVSEQQLRALHVLAQCLTQAGIKVPALDLPELALPSLEEKPKKEFEAVTTTLIVNPKYHVLLVEDDNVCIQLCRKFLVKYGCKVTVVTDGLNAISTLEHAKYDLVLMDIVMPNLDGATATSIIRSFDTKTPIIAMTGNIQDNDLVTYLQNGMLDILAKPFTKNDLYLILSKYLSVVKQEFQELPAVDYPNIPLENPIQRPIADIPEPTPALDHVILDPMDSLEANKKQRLM